MRRTLPSVRALESFEAVARYGNVTRAAEELGRTQSAVSRQVANLESFARRKLFNRHRKHLTLNEAGQEFSRKVASILDALEAETAKLMTFGKETRALRLGVSSTFGSRWLMPRLAGFAKVGGFAELCLANGLGRPAPGQPQIDAWIECSEIQPEGGTSQHLLDEEIVAVVAPELYGRSKTQLFDRLRLPSRCDTWKYWIEARGAPPCTQFSPSFEDYSLLIEAASLGFGVAVVPVIYLDQELSTHRLITPFGDPVRSGRSYWLTYSDSSPEKERVNELSSWLTSNCNTGPTPAPESQTRAVDAESASDTFTKCINSVKQVT
jgi:LysR family glycine cleavage system transcriptional activator